MSLACKPVSSSDMTGRLGRRDFLKTIVAGAAALATADIVRESQVYADGEYPSVQAAVDSMRIERISRLAPIGYHSRTAPSDMIVKWVQVDLGKRHAIEHIKLLPVLDAQLDSQHFPRRFYIQVADDKNFASASRVIDRSHKDYPAPGDKVVIFDTPSVKGRYVRFTATLLSGRALALSKLEVWSGGRDVAQGCRVTDCDQMEIFNAAAGGFITPAALANGQASDQPQYEILRTVYPTMPAYNGLGDHPGLVLPLTRRPRPQGEGVVTDNPENVIPAHLWKPVAFQAEAPLYGVIIGPGALRNAMENNITYLLTSFSNAELLRPFRTRAGKSNPPGLPPPIPFWDTALPGSSAGRFMMGAANTLRWIEHAELRQRLDALVAGIAECQEPNGYAMAYKENTIFYNERGNYTRSWVTHGLVDAGFTGNQTAFKVLRGYYDWFDQCPYLPQLLRRAGQGVQGMIANTRTYFTPVGKPKDIQVIQRYYQENYWLEMLSQRDPAAIWKYPYDHPHCYLLTSITPYLDQYRATGEAKYLNAVLGGWELYLTQWQHIGGAISICEMYSYPPKSAFLHLSNGEHCGSSFWISLNHSLHQLFPDREEFINQVEKSIYNVILANQAGGKGIRYHTNLDGTKEAGTAINTCCEGQGTRQYGSLPQYIYSVAADGIYVNLFANSTITSTIGRHAIRLEMITDFPFTPGVTLRVSSAAAIEANIRIRIPAWAAGEMAISINGQSVGMGKPGTYHNLLRVWENGDTIQFTLPMEFRLSLYTGMDQEGVLRYGVEYGPILLAVIAAAPQGGVGFLPVTEEEIIHRLRPIANQPLHFAIDGDPDHTFVPYWQIDKEIFTCFPMLKIPDSYASQTILSRQDDLALASKGATAASDSELSYERGCTAKVIDGIIATPADFTANRWHSSLVIPHPHWVQVNLPQPAEIGKIVINFADPLGHPTSFQGIVRVAGQDRVVFDVSNYMGWRSYTAEIPPVTTQTFRLVIRDSANPRYPNAAQISQIQLYPPTP